MSRSSTWHLRDALETLGALRPRQARLIVLQTGGLRHRDIREVTGGSHRTIDRQLRHAREALRCAVETEGQRLVA